MRRFKKVMLVTTVLGGVGLTATGAAQAADCGGDPPHTAIDNAQLLDCEQQFQSGLITINAPVAVLGDSVTNIGNFCTMVGQRQ
ncbi:hypothetical protein ABZV31_18945 [Streptomyces sp. NPDC005202]|uniref:hypothetical protein n=1 Tax=Streptomyces sp. NPDC005202 TaxID=3157021 RepID=UPI0033A94B68